MPARDAGRTRLTAKPDPVWAPIEMPAEATRARFVLHRPTFHSGRPLIRRRSGQPMKTLHRVIGLSLLVFLAALALRLAGADDRPMHPDEYYTILAARSLAAEGVPRIGDGRYVRAPAYTAVVAASLDAFGDSLAVARLASLFAGAAIVVLAFAWLRREAGALPAWLLAALLALSGAAIGMAQFARFYALHALAFLICALAVYHLVVRPHGRSAAATAAIALAAVLSALAAMHLQETTAIGLVGLGAWAAGSVVFRLSRGGVAERRILRGMLVALAVAIAGGAALVLFSDLAGRVDALYDRYRWTALWAEHQNYPRYYVHQLAGELPLLFYLYPVAALIALARAPRAAGFCIVVSTVAIVVHSFAGMKDLRYILYLWPLLLAPVAVAAEPLLRAMYRGTLDLLHKVAPPGISVARGNLRQRVYRTAAAGIVAGASVVALAGNPDFDTLRSFPRTIAIEFGIGEPARAARAQAAAERDSLDALRRVVGPDGFIVSSSDLLALWHLGRYDITLRAGRLREFAPNDEFDRDPRTGGMVISVPASLDRVMRCQPTGTVVIWPDDWRRAHTVTPAAADLIEATMREVALPPAHGVRAFQWHRPARADDCDLPFGRSRGDRHAAPLGASLRLQ
jgi:hypothetical protein